MKYIVRYFCQPNIYAFLDLIKTKDGDLKYTWRNLYKDGSPLSLKDAMLSFNGLPIKWDGGNITVMIAE